jgi:ATP synthase protein I
MLSGTGFVYCPQRSEELMGQIRELFRGVGTVSSMGISVALAIGISVWFGLKLDEWFNTKPVFFFIFLFIGIAAGYNNIYVITRREQKRQENDEDK